jgi:hypothetical protein
MRKSLIFAAAAIAIVLLSAPGTAKAQVAFGGTFRGPHGAFSIGVGGPFVPVVGAYVPQPYIDQVYLSPDYGYGFEYDSRWIPCRRYGSRWIIASRPIVFERSFVRNNGFRHFRTFRFDEHRFARRDFDDRRFFRRDRDDRRFRDGRHFRRDRDGRRW